MGATPLEPRGASGPRVPLKLGMPTGRACISSGFFIPSFVGSGLTAGGALPALVQGESDSVLDILWNKARTEVGQ